MKTTRYFVTMVFLCMAVIGANAQRSNRLSIESIMAAPGATALLPVTVSNTDAVVGLEFDLTLPERMTMDLTATPTDRIDGHMTVIKNMGGNTYKVLLYSPNNSSLKGNKGAVVKLGVHIPEDYETGKEYSLTLANAVLGIASGENVLTTATAGNITVAKLPDLTAKNISADKTSFTPGESIKLAWQVENLGQLETGDGWSEQVSIITEDGLYSKLIATEYYRESLAANSTVSRSVEVELPSLLGIDGNVKVQVKIIPFETVKEPAYARENNIGLSNTVYVLNKQLYLEISPLHLMENEVKQISVKLNRSGSWDEQQTFSVVANADNRITVPTSITIPKGQSGVMVNWPVVDNLVLDNDSVINIAFSGNGYSEISQRLIIVDNELPNLTLKATPSTITEGESISFVVTAQRAPSKQLRLTLSCDNAKRFEMPTEIFLPKNKKSVTFTVTSIDDDQPATTVSPTFTISADGYNSGEAITVLNDNDVPAISLTLTPTSMSESAGPAAMVAVLKRSSNSDKEITVKLSDDSPYNDINYGQFKSISMPKGVEEVDFSIGINDNLDVDGDRDVIITASVFIQSCSCNASGDDVGVVSQKIHIFDNDGPSLTMTSSRSSMLEGADEATVLTISRNTSTQKALTVSVTSNYDEGLEYAHSVVIPAGKKSVTVPVKALANLNENDNVVVTFTAKADGHSDATCWSMLSDQTMADAIIKSVELLTENGDPIGEKGVMVNSSVQARITLENIGVVDLPARSAVNVYQNPGQSRVAPLTISEPLAPGTTTSLSCILKVPDVVGSLSVFAKVNEDKSVKELIYANNTSTTATVKVYSSFKPVLSVDKNTLLYGDSVAIQGHLTQPDGSAWQSDGKTKVVLYFMIDGQRYLQDVMADEAGQFSFMWKPARSHMGHVSIGACHQGESSTEEMVGVDIYGIRRVSKQYETFYTILDQPYSGTISVQNPGRLPLTGFKVSTTNNPDGADVQFNAPKTINGGQTVEIDYTITGHKLGGDDWQKLTFNMSTAVGAELNHTLYYYTRNEQALLSCSIKEINATVTKGSTRDYSFNIANIGMGNSGSVSIVLPQWMQSVTPSEMPSMAHGDTTQVVIRLMPTDDMQLNVPVTGHIGINCENGQGLSLPFRIEPVSESKGKLLVDVCDEFTYYTEEAPHVSDATVTVKHPVTGAIIAQGVTDNQGVFEINLPEGYYSLLVTHPKHNSYSATILLDPGRTTTKVVNLMYDAIQVSWNVVETTVEDTYEIVTTVKYDTNVPVPVVVVNMPKSVPAKSLDEGESLVYYATLTNEGLITAKGVKLAMPEGFKTLRFEALDYEDLFDLAAHQSVVIPIKVTKIPSQTSWSAKRHIKDVDDDPCYANNILSYFYECGTDSVYHKYPTGIRVGDCDKSGASNSIGGSGPAGGGYDLLGYGWTEQGGGPSSRPNYPKPLFGTDVHVKPVHATGEKYKCIPCSNSVLLDLMKFIPIVGPLVKAADEAKNIINCGIAMVEDDNLHDKLANCKYTERAVKVYDKFADAARDLYDNVGEVADLSGDLYNHMKNNEFLTEECLEDWKGIFKAIYDSGNDIVDIADATQEISDGIHNIGDKVTNVIDQGKQMEREYLEGMNVSVTRTPDQINDIRLDKQASGEIERKREEEINNKKEALYNYLETDIATMEGLKTLTEDVTGVVVKDALDQEITKEDKRKILQEGVKQVFGLAWNAHDFKEKAKEMSYGQQNILKDAYLETENKVLEHVDDVVNLLDHTFGECEYEGDEKPNEGNDDINPGGGGGGGGSTSHAPKRITAKFNSIPETYRTFKTSMRSVVEILQAENRMSLEYFGAPEWLDLTPIEYAPVSWAIEKVKNEGASVIDNPYIGVYCPDGISEDMLRTFLRRWYNTYMNKETSAKGTYIHKAASDEDENRINLDLMEEMRNVISENIRAITEGQTGSIEEIITRQFDDAYRELTEKSNTVCASITLQFNQTMTMTRQAFRGTLTVHNGNTEEAMKDVTLQIEVRNASNGKLVTSREMYIGAESLNGFEGSLSLNGGWTLAANGDGTATILFIPSKYAAPTDPVDYTFGGTIKYLDPYSNSVVTRELTPVTLTVKPSPELDLDYFMQRDIHGDDPLTEEVEPMRPAEFALLLNNKGYGDATDVKMLTNQPQIIDNEKGLLIDFELISSQVNGGDAVLSLGQSISNDFGTISAQGQAYAQWWLQSTLLGHFTDYNVEVNHLTSYGNEDLSLIDQARIHELIHGYTANNSDGQALRGFLVNDIADAEDLPDRIYFTDATQSEVTVNNNATIVKQSDTEYLLTVSGSSAGWNYGSLLDPTQGKQTLASIVRQSDGESIPVDNIWQTDRTLRDGNDWLYENRLHFIGEMSSSGESYLLTFEPRPEEFLSVEGYEGLPDEGEVASVPVEVVTVKFNKAVAEGTFTTDDITLTCQGKSLDTSKMTITKVSDTDYEIDLTALTSEDGFYVLTVQTANISDAEGYVGESGKQAMWTQSGFLLGDVNYDRRINGMDIVELVELIMDSRFDRAGDLYPAGHPDGVLTGMDLVEEVELVMSQTSANPAPALVARTERLAMRSERNGVKSLGIQSDRPFILAQMTVELSDGMTLSSITSDRMHEVAYRQTGDNKYVVVCYSNRNETFEANGKALEFHCVGDGGIRVSDVLLIDADKQECLGTDAQSGDVTGIQEMKDERLKMNDSDIYDLNGRKIEGSKTDGQRSKLQKGVYIINKRKVTIK